MAKYVFKLMEIVMFVITSNPKAINRMKARKGGFFKGRVIRETSKEVWIEPLNKELSKRLENTSFFRVCAVIKGKKAQLVPTSCEEDNLYMEIIKDKHGRKNVRFTGIVILPKKQVDHFHGEKKRFNDALSELAKSDLVKKRNHGKDKKKGTKKTDWVYKV